MKKVSFTLKNKSLKVIVLNLQEKIIRQKCILLLEIEM